MHKNYYNFLKLAITFKIKPTFGP